MADVLLVSFLLYQVYQLLQGSMAAKAFVGFLLLSLIYLAVSAAGMNLLAALLGQFVEVGVLAVIILFQQEIKKFLFWVGGTAAVSSSELISKLSGHRKIALETQDITPIVEALKTLAGSNTGALIVLARDENLKFYEESGDCIDALTSKRLLISIFHKESPLHDGGVIIRKGRIVAARCILPVTEQRDLSAQFGLRHRAAIGMTEATSTLVLIVSEETGQIATAQKGRLNHNLSVQETRAVLKEFLKK